MQKELLTEENYERANKKIKKISLVILCVGLVIGLGLIILGVIKQIDAKNQNQALKDEAYAKSQAMIDSDNARLAEIAEELSSLNEKYKSKSAECASLDMSDPDWFSKKSICGDEEMEIFANIGKLELEQSKLKNANHTVYYNPIPNMTFIIFYIIGGGIIFMSGIISLAIWLITKRRAIAAYGVQTVRPIAKEGIEKATPTISKTVEEISKGVSKGIKEGKE